jgi:hypothetical protein
MIQKRFLQVLLFGMLVFSSTAAFSQESDTTKSFHFNGNVSVSNNGFSFIPTFNLGKPAAIATLSIGGDRFSFDPQFRFDLDGLRPWSFIFIWRYKVIKTDRWMVRAGLHLPAIAFRTREVDHNGIMVEEVYAQRFMTPELTTSYTISDRLSIGTYYIYGRGLEKEGQSKNTHFMSLQFGVRDIRISEQVYLNWNPELYYLDIDGADGVYVAQNLTLTHKKSPFSISSMMNKGIDTTINSGNLDWNISLTYSFKNELKKK